MVNHCKTIENREHRNKYARAIITLMGQMNPHLRNVEEFKHKLWDHLHMMAGFDLDIDSPYPVPAPEEVQLKAIRPGYPQSRMRFKHYGKNVETLVAKAIKMPEGDKRDQFAKVIAGYMKMVYGTRSHDYISDEIIKNDLLILSDGVLDIGSDTVLGVPKSGNQSQQSLSRKKKRSRNNNSRSNNNYRRRK